MAQATLGLDYDKFAVTLESVNGVNVHSYKDHHGWFKKHGDSKYNNVIEYEYQKNSKDDLTQYRTWYMETSVVKENMGLIVSTKIDHIRGGQQDDHIILICGFNLTGELVVAQASVQITDNPKYNQTVPPQTLAMAGGDSMQIDNLVYNILSKVDFKDFGRNTIAAMVKGNIIALREAVKTA